MKQRLRTLGAILLLSLPLSAQPAPDLLSHSGEGREFWLCFQKNFRNVIVDEATQESRPAQRLALSIALSSQYSTEARVEVPGLGFTRVVALSPGTAQLVSIPITAEVTSSDFIERLGVHITSEAPVVAIGLNTRYQTTDTYMGIPVDALGTEYRVAGYRVLQNDLVAQLAVVATQDSTVVRITPTSRILTQPPEDMNAVQTAMQEARTRRGRFSDSAQARNMPPQVKQRIDSLRRVREARTAARGADTTRLDSAALAIVRLAATPAVEEEVEYVMEANPRPAGKPVPLARERQRPARPDGPGAQGGQAHSRLNERPDAVPRGEKNLGDTIVVRLNRGDVYQLRAGMHSEESDLTGSLIRSNRPVAVFSGHNCGYVPDYSVKACNMLVEQIPPISAWGRRHVVGRLKERSFSVVRIVPAAGGTEIVVNGKPVLDGKGGKLRLNAGSFHEIGLLSENVEIITSRPALVVQYAPGYNNGDNAGDPMMIVVPPVEQFGTVFAASTVVHGSWRHYVNIVAPTASLAKLSIDGAAVDATLFARLPDSDLSVGAVEVASGHHVFASESPFGLYSYGIGLDDKAYDAYGHGGGQLYNDLRQVPKGDGGMESAPDIGALIHRR